MKTLDGSIKFRIESAVQMCLSPEPNDTQLLTQNTQMIQSPAPSIPMTTTSTTTTYVGNLENNDDARSDVASWGSVGDNDESSTITAGTSNATLSPKIDVLYREEDILLSLQLLAYLSKYPHIRTIFHSAYPPHNVFSLVERFTHRLHPAEIQYWAGVIMRNACRKDEARGGVRQCAYMACGKWEILLPSH
ncbi:9139_t:CDS:2 [Entrophospora sp. SA101]|nr:9139_t:CDS:2 [Entrophospora sp. SA101]